MSRKCQHCESKVFCRNLCKRHYQQFNRSGNFFYQEIKWSKKNSCCIKCKSSERIHASKGLCSPCYQNLPEQKLYTSQWAKNNKEKCRAATAKYRRNNLKKCRERARLSQIKFHNESKFGGLRNKILERDKYQCVKCEKPVCKPCQAHVHHKDGDKSNNIIDNLETLCSSCHARHHTNCRNRCANGRFK